MAPSSTPSAGPSTSTIEPANRHALTAVERQRSQLERLLKDPAKPAFVPAPPQAKEVRPPREMMKNVQGSSAGAGSGEFHVYKASRRREYERLKLLEETTQKKVETEDYERKRAEKDAVADAKTAKNRAKRQKKKDNRGKGPAKDPEDDEPVTAGNIRRAEGTSSDAPIKKRRLVGGKELLFKRPGEDSDGEQETVVREDERKITATEQPAVLETPALVFHDDD